MERHRYRLPLAIVAAVVAAGAATLLLRPRNGLIDAAAVEATAYFSPEELDRAREFRGPQRLLALAGLAVSGGTLALLALRLPRRIEPTLARAGARPVLGGAVVGAALFLVVEAVTLPIGAIAHERAVDVGLSTQDWGEWLADGAKSAAVGAPIAAGAAALALVLVRRFPRHWWAPGALAVVAVSAAFVFVAPVVLDPIFNRFERLPNGELRSDVLDLARRSDVEVGEVYRIDASRRTTGANAYVGGLGSTKRVVLYDNLVEDFPPEQVRSVVAHELAHVSERDVPRGLLWLAIAAPAGMLLVQRLTEAILARRSERPARPRPFIRGGGLRPALVAGTPAAVPALALSLAVVSFGGTLAGTSLSRRVEARADAFALDLTREPAAFIALERRLAVRNVSDPDPPELLHTLFGTHPTTVERIGFGLTWARGR